MISIPKHAVLISLLAAGCFTGARKSGTLVEGNTSCSVDFSAVKLQAAVRKSIVRIESDAGSGTGFVVARSGDGLLVATNHHVIRTAKKLDAVFDSGMRLGNLEVVKIDADRDLALLLAAGAGRTVPGLRLANRTVQLGERVAALGYPYVAGEDQPSLTFEDGSVTNASTELDGKHYVRTNANINPGNSGGPVIDACGEVVGVVVAMHTETQRTGLIIPGGDLRTLVVTASTPRSAPETELRVRVQALETAVRYRRGGEVAAMFSRTALDERVSKAFMSYLEQTLENAHEKVNLVLREKARTGEPLTYGGRTILDYAALPASMRGEVLASALDQNQAKTVMLGLLIAENKIDTRAAMLIWLGDFVHELFGASPTFTIERMKVLGTNSAATLIRIGSAYWVFGWVYEWGDWRIDAYSCERGCD